MKIVCDACGAKYSIADEKVAGKVFKIRCKKCSNIIVVRGNAEEAAAAAAAAPEEAQPNKDTKVFDYAGYDSPQEAMAAAAEGEWHLVIDQEQVGPMTSAEVRERFAAGEVDAESYIWKEGFGDWERIPDVPEFADLEAGAAPAAAVGGGLFGDDMGDDATAQANPNDLFGGGGDSGGADLFGGGGDSGGSDLFGGAASVGENTGEVEMSADAEAQLKGQRNENSVLFSLGNLAALASDSPKPAATSSSSLGGGGGGGAVANTGGSEGSGLIDIRSMANVYLADKKQPGMAAAPVGSADDLPVFSQSAFESASPVLLPTQGGGTDKKLLYTLIGVIGVLGLAAIVLVVIVLSGGDDEKSEPVAAADVAEATVGDGDGDDGTETTGGDTKAVGDDTADVDPAPTPDDGTATPDPEGTPDPAPTATTTTPKPRTGTRTPKPRTGTRTPKPPKPPKPPKEESGGGGSCDEVTCLVDPGKACCKKYNKGSSSSSSSSSSSNSNLPEKPTRGDITAGIGKVRGRVTSCGDKHGGKGTVKVKLKIGGDGKVKSAQASGGGSALRSCVTSAVKRAKFKKTQKGMTVTYPFVFR